MIEDEREVREFAATSIINNLVDYVADYFPDDAYGKHIIGVLYSIHDVITGTEHNGWEERFSPLPEGDNTESEPFYCFCQHCAHHETCADHLNNPNYSGKMCGNFEKIKKNHVRLCRDCKQFSECPRGKTEHFVLNCKDFKDKV